MLLPEFRFDYLSDGHVDLWFKKDPLFTDDIKNIYLDAITDSGYTYTIRKKRRNAEVRIREKDNPMKTNPNLQGYVQWKSYGARVVTDLRNPLSLTNRNFNDFITSHEVGHVLGLDHRFDTPVSDTVMNYPRITDLINGNAATRLTESDLNNTRNFHKAITNEGFDLLTGIHYCTAGCSHFID